MQLKKLYSKILLTGLCILAVSATANAEKKNSKEEPAQQQKTAVIEEKTGISTQNNMVLASLYKEAVEWLKTPYRRGGMSHRGMDCSGLTGTIYENVFGVKLQRRSKDISNDVEHIAKEELKPGDLVFFGTSRRKKGVNHVGVYLGNKHFVHASVSKGVIISSLDEPYYSRTWIKGGRVKDCEECNKAFEGLLAKHKELNIENLRAEAILIEDVKDKYSAEDVILTIQDLGTL